MYSIQLDFLVDKSFVRIVYYLLQVKITDGDYEGYHYHKIATGYLFASSPVPNRSSQNEV